MIRGWINSSLVISVVREKLLKVRYDWSTVVKGAKEGAAKGIPTWIRLGEATMRLFTEDPEATTFLFRLSEICMITNPGRIPSSACTRTLL